MIVALALAAAVGYGVSDFCGGLASRRISPVHVLVWMQAVGVLLLLGVWAGVSSSMSISSAALAGVAGFAGAVGFLLMFKLMATAPISSVSPITALLAAGTPLAFGLLAGERLGLAAWLGTLLALPAIILIVWEGSDRPAPRVLLMALGSGLGFGMYFVLLAATEPGQWALVLLIARVTGLVAILVAARNRRIPVPARTDLPVCGLAVLAGVTDTVADAGFLIASQQGTLASVGVIVALYPAVTVLLACAMLRERATIRSGAGLGLALVSLALFSR